MRILNAFMLHGRSLQEIFSLAARSGCDGISIEPSHLDDPALDALTEWYALNIPAVGAFFLDECDIPGCLESIGENAAKAAVHGIGQLCVVLINTGRAAVERSDRLRLLRAAVSCTSRYGVRLSLEPLHRSMRHISSLTDLDEAAELIREVASPWLTLTLDIAHCFADGTNQTDVEAMAPLTGSVHLADLIAIDQDEREFPGEGRIPFAEIVFRLRNGGYRGDWELEVIRSDLAKMPEDVLCRKIAHSFAVTGSTVVCGELALHVFLNDAGQIIRREAGGGSGMIAAQMRALGHPPVLLGVCGDDAAGRWLSSSVWDLAPFLPCQQGRATSLVTLHAKQPERISIRAGNVGVSQLADQILRLPDSPCCGYLPLFPGYETLLEVLAGRPAWRMIHDFGYYLWCGNPDELTRCIAAVERPGFCALVNAKDMDYAEKKTLGYFCLERGYRHALLTDRDKAVLLFSHDCPDPLEIPVEPLESPVDTCGAGDCFTAGLLSDLEQGERIETAVRTGVRIARQKLQTIGIWRPE